MSGYTALSLMVLLTASGQLLFKGGAARIDFSGGLLQGLRSMANPLTLLGAAAAAGAPLLYMYALSRLPLSVAYGFSGFTYVLVAAGSRILIGERVTLYHILGSIVILAGLAIWNGPSIFPS